MNSKQQTNEAIIQLMHRLSALGKEPLPADRASHTQQSITTILQQLQELNAIGRLQGLVVFGVTLPDEDGRDFIHAINSPPAQLARIALAMPKECMRITQSLTEMFADELVEIQQLQAAENPEGKFNA